MPHAIVVATAKLFALRAAPLTVHLVQEHERIIAELKAHPRAPMRTSPRRNPPRTGSTKSTDAAAAKDIKGQPMGPENRRPPSSSVEAPDLKTDATPPRPGKQLLQSKVALAISDALVEWAVQMHMYCCYVLQQSLDGKPESEHVLMHALQRSADLVDAVRDAKTEALRRNKTSMAHDLTWKPGETVAEAAERIDSIARTGSWVAVPQIRVDTGNLRKPDETALRENWTAYCRKANIKFDRTFKTKPNQASLYPANSASLLGMYSIHPEVAAWTIRRMNGTRMWPAGSLVEYK